MRLLPGSALWLGVVMLAACGGEAAHSPARADDAQQPASSGGSSSAPTPHGGATPNGGTTSSAGGVTTGGNVTTGGAVSAGGGGEIGGASTNEGGEASTNEGGEASANEGGEGGAVAEPPHGDCDPIVFEDPELELAVRAELGNPTGPLRAADVQGFTQLVTPTITSLKGVECLLDLTALHIGSQPPSKVTDLSPLRGLKKLVDVDLDRNPLASLAPLGELPNLESLYMLKMPVPLDLAPLAGAPKLSNLLMQGDDII
ncbi:MAG TPA: hypothetical protein VEQ58_16190, partial [Polyangiaceae bacterium]|nr:hypothetical protein [Polyangiaceae bacterium]